MAHPRYLRIARKMAMLSSHHFRLGSCLVKSGRVLSRGFNHENATNHLTRRYFKHWPATCHAEIASLAKLSSEEIQDSILYVYRIRKNGSGGLSKPCPRCLAAMKDLGVKRVVFSIENEPYYEVQNVA